MFFSAAVRPARPRLAHPHAPSTAVRTQTVDHLLGPNGIAYVANTIPEKFAAIAKGPGHEFGDFARLMGLYREWTRKMYPYATHEEVIQKVKRLSKTREVRACAREVKERERMELGGEGISAPEDFNPEDVFFPDDEEEGDAGAAGDAAAGDEDDEEEWNEGTHGGEGDDEDEELAILMEQEREFVAAKKGRDGKSSISKGEEAAVEENEEEEELDILRREEEAAEAFDDRRREELENINFDESSDDDELEIALPQRGRGVTARKVAALGSGEKGKARKKLKEKVKKRKAKTSKMKETDGTVDDSEAAEPNVTGEEAFEGERAASEPEPVLEAEPSPEPARKKLRMKGRSRAGRDAEDSEEDDESEKEIEAAARRPKRRVAIDSDSDDDAVPMAMGGDAFVASPLPSLSRPSFLYEDDGDDN